MVRIEKSIKVLLVHNYYQIPGGEDTVVANEKTLLEDNEHEVILYSRNNSELKEFSKFQKLLLPFSTVFNIRTFKEVKEIIKEQSVDIVHVHNTLNLISPSVYYAAYSCKVPVVQTVHNFRLLCPGATFYRDGRVCEDCLTNGLGCSVRHRCYRNSRIQTLACVTSTIIHRMTGIYGKINYICLTEFNKEKLLNLKQIKSDRVFVKPNFVKNNDIVIPYKERKNQFVFAGRLDRLKGIDILLETWKRLGVSAPKLMILGTGPMEVWCKQFIAENKLVNVEMKGFTPNAEVRKIIASSKALILPTQWYEGFPMTIVEAFSVGTPVIGSDIGNVGSIIENGNTGWKFQTGSIEHLSNVINNVTDIVAKVRREYSEKYLTESNYEILCTIYQKVK